MLLPASGFGLAVFAGWVMPKSVLIEELGLSPTGALVMSGLLRYVAPVGIAAVALASLLS
jgi:NSS family neurotransmitter:Na+ symporter